MCSVSKKAHLKIHKLKFSGVNRFVSNISHDGVKGLAPCDSVSPLQNLKMYHLFFLMLPKTPKAHKQKSFERKG